MPASGTSCDSAFPDLRLTILLVSLLPVICQADFCVIIDAGSSGSRVHIFEYFTSPAGGLALVEETSKSLKNLLPLSSFAAQPGLAGPSLGTILQYAEQQVPVEEQAKTSVHLLATAGMRLLEDFLATAILDSCSEILRQSAFIFEDSWALVVPGSSEGVYGFVAANYASGALQKWTTQPRNSEAIDFWGVLELGGASLQVTYPADGGLADQPESLPFMYELTLAGQTLSLFTHSFLGFGQDAALSINIKSAADGHHKEGTSVITDPCIPSEFSGVLEGSLISGTGDFDSCKESVMKLVSRSCTKVECGLAGLLLPPLTGKFLCIENLQYTAGFLSLPHNVTLRQFQERAETVCGMPWQEMLNLYTSFEEEHLLRYCFGAAYGLAVLQDGLRIDADSNKLLFADTIESASGHATVLDWALGAVVVAASSKSGMNQIGAELPRMVAIAAKSTTDMGLPSTSVVLVMMLMLIIVITAFFALTPSRRRQLRRTTKRLRSLVRKNSSILIPDDDSDENSSDSELVWKSSKTGPAFNVGRRQNSGRDVDVESGLAP